MPSVKKSYKHPDIYYAERFNISTSSVFRYRKEFAPLDNDKKFYAWIAQRAHKPLAMRTPGGARNLRVKTLRQQVLTKSSAKSSPIAEDEEPPDETSRPIIEGGG